LYTYTSGVDGETKNCEITWYSLTCCEIIKDISAWYLNARDESIPPVFEASRGPGIMVRWVIINRNNETETDRSHTAGKGGRDDRANAQYYDKLLSVYGVVNRA